MQARLFVPPVVSLRIVGTVHGKRIQVVCSDCGVVATRRPTRRQQNRTIRIAQRHQHKHAREIRRYQGG